MPRWVFDEPPAAKELANGQIDGACFVGNAVSGCASELRRAPFAPVERCSDRKRTSLPGEKCKATEIEQVTWVLAHPTGYLADSHGI